MHALAAYKSVFESDFRVDAENPPLWNHLAMLPHSRGELKPNPEIASLDPARDGFMMATRLLYQTHGNDGAAIINRSRSAMLLLGVALGVALACWSWKIGGPLAAVVACTFFALDPTFIAHAPLIKNDTAMSLIYFLTAFAVWSVGRHARWWNILALLPLLGGAMTIKFSAPIAGAALLALLLIRAFGTGGDWKLHHLTLRSSLRRCGLAAAIALATVFVAWGIVWACYDFRFDPTPDPSIHLNMSDSVRTLQRNQYYIQNATYPSDEQLRSEPIPISAKLMSYLAHRRVLPQAWLVGSVNLYAVTLVRQSYLLGETSMTGWWYYFPLAVLFKTPIATLIAGGIAAIAVFVLRRRLADGWTLACMVVPMIIYGGFALTTNLNLGVRHLLPVYPFVFLVIGLVSSKLYATEPKASIAVAFLLAFTLVAETLLNFPHELSFFNVIARPHRLSLLSDSNFDWGQDLPYVARWQKEHPGVKLYLAYWGPSDPRFYGIDYTNLPGGFGLGHDHPPLDMSAPGMVMISATLLQGVNAPGMQDFYAALRNRPPDGLVGDSIYLYRWPLKP